MRIGREPFGTSRGHGHQPPLPVEVYTLDTGADLAVEVLTYGAHLIGCHVPDRTGEIADVALRLPDLAAYEDRRRNPYLGATVGPYAFRLADARLELAERTHELTANDGRHCLHGGDAGLDRYVWAAEADTGVRHCELRLRLELPDGAGGFPGPLQVETVYRVDDEQRLTFEHHARSQAETIVNMTNHAYWNLAGAGTILDHELRLNASTYVPADAEVIPTGPPEPVAGSRFDFTTARPIRPGGLDTFYLVDGAGWAAELHDPGSGRTMTVATDQPGLNVYTADSHDPPHAGICLETGFPPDAPNQPHLDCQLLRPGELYRHRTVHTFTAAS